MATDHNLVETDRLLTGASFFNIHLLIDFCKMPFVAIRILYCSAIPKVYDIFMLQFILDITMSGLGVRLNFCILYKIKGIVYNVVIGNA